MFEIISLITISNNLIFLIIKMISHLKLNILILSFKILKKLKIILNVTVLSRCWSETLLY